MERGGGGGGRLAQLGEGRSWKSFVGPGSVDRVGLGWGSGAAVELAWDVSVTPYVGVWVCNGDLGGYRQVAIQPGTGGAGGPALSAPGPFVWPGEGLRWRL